MVGEAANDADEIETILEEAQRLIKQADNRPPFSTPEDSNSALSTLRKARDLYRQGYRESIQKNALLVEAVSGLEILKATRAEGPMLGRWEQIVGQGAHYELPVWEFWC